MARRQISPAVYLILGVVLIGAAMLMAVAALPGLHAPAPPRQGHYESQSRQWQAQQGRAIIANPQNPCQFYDCDGSGSLLRVCVGETDAGEVVRAVQWLFWGESGWQEGTIFLQDKPHKVDNYLRNYGCKEAQ